MNQLQTINTMTAVDVFNGHNAEVLIEDIEKEVRSFVPDLSSVKGRKEIASLSAKVSKSKVVLDGLGKALVADWKASAKLVDSDRKMVRDRLDALRDEVRQPLTDWEVKEKARIEAERLAKKLLNDHEQALAEDDLFNRQKEIERKEAEQIKIEADRVAKLEAERIEKERVEREEQIEKDRIKHEEKIRLDAIRQEKLDRDAELEKVAIKAAKEKADAEQKIIDANAAVEREKLKAKEAAEQAERDTIQAVKDAEKKASDEAAQKEADRIAKETEELAERNRLKAIEEKKAANKRHQASVNNKILNKLMFYGMEKDAAKKMIGAIVMNEIDNLTINY